MLKVFLTLSICVYVNMCTAVFLCVCSGGDCALHSAEASREDQIPCSTTLCHGPFKTGSLTEPGASLAVGQPQGPPICILTVLRSEADTQLFTFIHAGDLTSGPCVCMVSTPSR